MIQLKQNIQRQKKKLKHLNARLFNSSSLILSQKRHLNILLRLSFAKFAIMQRLKRSTMSP